MYIGCSSAIGNIHEHVREQTKFGWIGKPFHRVAWKIIRGLYFHNFQEVLPEDTPNIIEIVPPSEPPPPEFFTLPDEPVRGRYPTAQTVRKTKRTKLADEPFIGMWRGREDMQDSTAWVRSLRRREWEPRL